MKPTVSGTDEQEYRHVSQSSPSSEAKCNIHSTTAPSQHIIYTTAQLHETYKKVSGRKAMTREKEQESILYKTKLGIVGLLLKFTTVKIRGPNKRLQP